MTARLAYGRTNQYGISGPFWLDAGTVYVKRTKVGFSFANPDTEIVVA